MSWPFPPPPSSSSSSSPRRLPSFQSAFACRRKSRAAAVAAGKHRAESEREAADAAAEDGRGRGETLLSSSSIPSASFPLLPPSPPSVSGFSPPYNNDSGYCYNNSSNSNNTMYGGGIYGGCGGERSEPDSDFEYDIGSDGGRGTTNLLQLQPASIISPSSPSSFYSSSSSSSPSPPPPSLSPPLSTVSEDEGLGLAAATATTTTAPPPPSQSQPPPRRHRCPQCPRSFPHASQLEEHALYRHSDARPHTCPSCQKSFKTKSNLNQHLRTHQGATLECPKCGPGSGKRFTANGLRYHLLTHRREEAARRHPCPHCGRTFLQNKLLQKHLRCRHSAERNFKCPHCPAAFKRKDHLDRHAADSHCALGRGARLFECSNGCGAGFVSMLRLRQHQRRCGGGGKGSTIQDRPLSCVDSPPPPSSTSCPETLLQEFGDSVTDSALDEFIRSLILEEETPRQEGLQQQQQQQQQRDLMVEEGLGI